MEPIKQAYLVEFKNMQEDPNTLCSLVVTAPVNRTQAVVDYVRKQGESIRVESVYVKVENWKC